MISIKVKSDFKKVDNFFQRMKQVAKCSNLDKYGRMGVDALSRATPIDSGKTASSWKYKIERTDGHVSIIWSNENVNEGVNIAIILQYGHGTGTGGYIQGIDYINPAIKPVFKQIEESVWKEVTSK